MPHPLTLTIVGVLLLLAGLAVARMLLYREKNVTQETQGTVLDHCGTDTEFDHDWTNDPSLYDHGTEFAFKGREHGNGH